MSKNMRFISPLRALSTVAGGLIITSLLIGSAMPSNAVPPSYGDTMPLSQIKIGMTGYGLTTFKGTTISRFGVKILGILKKENVGHDLILIRMNGGPITERGANLIQGMSGSPIYIGGKVIGAFSMGERFSKEPIGMVTPIQDMLEAWDPSIPQKPSYFEPAEKNLSTPTGMKVGVVGGSKDTGWKSLVSGYRNSHYPQPSTIWLTEPIVVGSRNLTEIVINASLGDPRISSKDVAVMHRATSMLSVPGISARNRAWLQQELDKRGYSVTVDQSPGGGASSQQKFAGGPLKPGSAFGTWLATGDVPVGGTGTVTYRRGNRMLGFGHPLFGLGALEAAITSAYILDIFPSLQSSHHIAIAGPTIGTLAQDRNFSVSADIGKMPHMVPFDITVHDSVYNRSQTFHSNMFLHPDMTPVIMGIVAREAVTRVHSEPGDVMAKITTTVDAAEIGQISRSNTVFDSTDISGPAGQDLNDIMTIVTGNPFYPLPIKSARMTIDIMPGHKTATVERIFLKQGHYEPGDTVEVGVVLKPYRRDAVTRTISLKIPSDTPTGRYSMLIRGGQQNIIRFGGLSLGGGGDAQTAPVSVQQMVARLNMREKNTDLVARLQLNSTAPSVAGEKLSDLPSNLSALMRTDRNSGIRMERDELRAVQPTEYVTSGAQQLTVNVVKKNTQEQPAGIGFSGSSQSGLPGGSSPSLSTGSGLSGLSASAEPDFRPGSVGFDTEMEPFNLLAENPNLKEWLYALQNAPPVSKIADKAGDKAVKSPQSPITGTTAIPSGQTAPVTPPIIPPPPDNGNDRPVARQAKIWKQTARTDFSAGKLVGVSLAANGMLRPAPRIHLLHTSSETYIWSLAVDNQGNVFAGTGTTGKILKIGTDGGTTTFAELPAISVQTLFFSKDGSLWAGSGANGKIFKVQPDGSSIFAAHLKEKYILGFAEDSQGNLFVGAGGGGTVYKLADTMHLVKGKELTPAPFLKTASDHIMALAIDKEDNLYVGTGNEGIVYKVTPDGKSKVLFDAKENSITALALDGKGNLYAATGPRGVLYRIAPDGAATTIFDRSASFYTSLKAAPDNSIYATTVNALFHFTPSATDSNQMLAEPLDNPKDIDFLSIALLPDGSVVTGTGNIGEIYGVGPRFPEQTNPNSGSFVSVIHDSRLTCQWGAFRWEGSASNGTEITAETRTGNVAEPDSSWSDWTRVSSTTNKFEGTINSPAARFIQYRLQLKGSATHVPSVREVSISYLPRNQAPKVAFQLPLGGERWAKSQTVRWLGTDPDSDTLTYELTYSNDGGVSWKPIPTSAKPVLSGGSNLNMPILPAGGTPLPITLEAAKKNLDATNYPDSKKAEMLETFKRSLASPVGVAAPLKDTSKLLDTSQLPDGTYWLKIVASDYLSNPTQAETAQAVSEPFLICNALPQIHLPAKPTINQDKSVLIEGNVTQSLISVIAVQYRIDGGEWNAVVPKSGLFDSTRESFMVLTPSLATGKHTIEIEAFNSANGKSIQKVEVGT